jgi:SAM-dependent methyltransferase
MDVTGAWDATRELRAFERRELGLAEGDRLLDVGCGLGDAAIDLAEYLGRGGGVVGIDKSTEMLSVARVRACAARCSMRFVVGDALALDEPDASFDAVRSERTLQWLADP